MRAVRVKKRYRRRVRKEVADLRRENTILRDYGAGCFEAMCRYKDDFYALLTRYNDLRRKHGEME